MANVKRVLPKTEIKIIEPMKIVLTLTEEEASYLCKHLGQTSGGHSYQIYHALYRAGVPD